MAESQWLFSAVLLLVSHGSQCSPVLPPCPGPCPCQRGPLLNCSSSGLSTAPGHIPATVTELDLSHNLLSALTLRRPHRNIQDLWLGSNGITHLSLCTGRTATSQDVNRVGPQSRRACLSWAPALQLLSVERNQLVQLPEGLGGSVSLRVLQLSHNRISTLRPGDLSSLFQLRELHLQHNHLTSLHPQAFRNLSQLRVLDLSFNVLSTLPPSTYLSLRNLRAEVGLRGNRWRCDCSLRSVRRWMLYHGDQGQPAWRLVCDSPPALSGRDLLQLEEGDLTCTAPVTGPALHQDVTVHEGSEILLQCSSAHEDSTWWTPNGQVSATRSDAGLLIRDITERHTGLYVCMSQSQQQLVSVFNLQIWKTGRTQRKTRSPRSSPWGGQLVIPQQDIQDRGAQVRNTTGTQSDDLALAVSLSVVFTFLVAFILGVLARPLIDILWRRICTKKSSSATYSVSSAEHGPYDNGGYSDGEEPGEISAHRERRVTFSTLDVREHSQASNSSVPYYDTVASVNQVSHHDGGVKESGAICVGAQEGCFSVSSAVAGREKKKKPEAGGSDSDSSSGQDSPKDEKRGQKELPDVTHSGTTHSVEFEHIPDPEDQGERRSSSSNSHTSHSDQERNEEQRAQKVEDTPQQRSQSPTVRLVEVPQIFNDGTSEIPGFSSEPFADWPPNTNESEMWNESGDSFEFADSFQGASPRPSSLLGSLDHSSAFTPSDNRKHPNSTSSSSTLSSDDQTHYTVNSEREEDEDTEASQNTQFTHDTKPDVFNPYLTQEVSFEQKLYSEDPFKPSSPGEGFNQGDSRWETQSPPMGPRHSHSSTSSDSDDEYIAIEDSNKEKIRVSDKSAGVVITTEGGRAEEISPAPRTDPEPKAKQPDLIPGVLPGKKKRKAPLPPAAVASSSSSESDAETTDHMVEQHCDGAKTGTTSEEPETRWPDLTHQSIPKIKRRLDIKAPAPDTSSSSGGSEDETTNKSLKQEDVMRTTLCESQMPSQRTETEWPGSGLSSVPGTKRYLDIKAPSPPKSSSSSSEDETADHKVGRGEEEAKVPEITYKQPPNNPVPVPPKRAVRIKSDSSASNANEREEGNRQDPSSTSTKVGPEPGSKWPGLAPVIVPRTKKRLDIKAPSPPHSESSSSSESDNETKDHTVYQERDRIDVGITSHEPNTKWPEIDLQSIPKIKRRLDIKAPSPPHSESSSSSESDNETKDPTVYRERDRIDVGITSHEPNTKWPEIDLQSIPKIKRRLDIKAPSPPHSESSSSSESDNETKDPTVYQERDRIDVGITSHEPNTKWPEIDLQSIPKIKRHLDIKAPSPPPDSSSSGASFDNSAAQGPLPAESSSSSSESDGENKEYVVKQEREVVMVKTIGPLTPKTTQNIKLENQASITNEKERTWAEDISPAPMVKQETRWAGLGLSIPRFKKHLNLTSPKDGPPKVPTIPPPKSSSSSSESENEKKDPQIIKKKGVTYNKELSPSPVDKSTSVSLTLTSADNLFSNYSGEVKDRSTIDYSFPATEAKPDPGVMWTDLGVPSARRRLDIKIPEEAPPAVPPSLPPDSSSSSESEDGTSRSKGFGQRAEVPGFPTTEAKPHPGSMWTGLGVPGISRRLDIKIREETPPAVPAPLSPDSSSSSDSEDETSGHTGKEFVERSEALGFPTTEAKPHPGSMWTGLGVPGIKRHLDIKIPEEASSAAPSPRPPDSSSSSESEDDTSFGFAASQEPEIKWPDLDLQNIPHIKRRLDIKAPSPLPPGDYPSSSSNREDEAKGHTVSHAPRRALNISFDELVRRRMEQKRQTPDVDLAPELQWKGIGRYSPNAISISQEGRAVESALNTSSLRQVDVDIKLTQKAPPTVTGGPPLSSSSSSSSESGDEIAQDGEEKPKITLSHQYSSISPGSVSLVSRRAVDIKFDNSSTSTDVTDWKARSEDRKERRGLAALKAMSSDKQTWETVQEEQPTVSFSVRQDQSITYPTSTIFKSSDKHRESLAKMSTPELPISTILPDEPAAGSAHRISRLRRRAVVAFQPPPDMSPPVPDTAPPVEVAAGSTWRSPQRQDWSSMGSYLQKEMSVDAHVSSSMSSESRRDEGLSPSFIGLIGATPYHTHTAPKRYHSMTSSTTTQTLKTDHEQSNTSSTISKKQPLFDHSNSVSEV